MKASELRIGNLVEYTNGGIFKVIGIHGFGLDVEDEIEITYMELENFEPIPLTEEWLLKFNEVRKFGGTIYLPLMNLKAEIHFEIYGNHIVSTVKSDFAELILDPIKHVHQLQNLYFVLTNEELTYEQQK